jgi:predicted PurR-regulated permease PerM
MTDTVKFYYVTQGLTLVALISILTLGLLPALLGGLLVYFLVSGGGSFLHRTTRLSLRGGRALFLAFFAFLLICLATIGVKESTTYLSEDGVDGFVALFTKMADIVDTARDHLPPWAKEYVPSNMQEWQLATAKWLRENAGRFSVFGQEVGLFFLHVLIGMIIGAMVAVKPGFQRSKGPLAVEFSDRVRFIGAAFQRVVFSQIRISALNTVLTAIFLAGVLPLLGYPLPLTKTMIVVTFLVGLLPIIGNLISNTVIFLIALSVAPMAAVISIVYLIVIHKLEYFVNAHIIGTRIKAQAWELLIAMLVMETLFGLPGLVAAPIYYAYLKDELSSRKLI